MLAHGSAKIGALATRCATERVKVVNGWAVDLWEMTSRDVDLAIEVYEDVLSAGAGPQDAVIRTLARQGVDLTTLLLASGLGSDLLTRADIAELAAAAAMIAVDGCEPIRMHMPNIPKMSRRKSDSGIDVLDLALDPSGPDDGLAADALRVGSVKHTTRSTTDGLRNDIARSLTTELTQAYLVTQFRVAHARLLEQGIGQKAANRTFLFINGFPDRSTLVGSAVVDPAMRDDIVRQTDLLPPVDGDYRFRIVLFPDLANVHKRCP